MLGDLGDGRDVAEGVVEGLGGALGRGGLEEADLGLRDWGVLVALGKGGIWDDLPTTRTPFTCLPSRRLATTGPVAAAACPLSALIGQIEMTLSLRFVTPASLTVYPSPVGSSLNVATLPWSVPTKHAMLE